MNFSFEVGDKERHVVDFNFNWFWGNLEIRVDGDLVTTDLRLVSLSLVKKYEFTVGDKEAHDVVIEMERKLLFAGFRAKKFRIYVDGKLVEQHEGL